MVGAGALSAGVNPFGRAWQGYCRALESKPLLIKSATSLVGFGLGDVIAQKLNNKDGVVDWNQVARMSTFGGLVMGPISHAWFLALDSRIFPNNPTCNLAIITKTALDQVVQAPIGLSIFYAYKQMWEGKPETIVPTIKKMLLPTLIMSWKFWPFAHAINFAFVPPEQRVLYANIVSVIYTAMLSSLASSADAETAPVQTKQRRKRAEHAELKRA